MELSAEVRVAVAALMKVPAIYLVEQERASTRTVALAREPSIQGFLPQSIDRFLKQRAIDTSTRTLAELLTF